MTVMNLTDADIRDLEIEAERLGDIEFVRICLLAYRDNGGISHPLARARCVALFNERAQWRAEAGKV